MEQITTLKDAQLPIPALKTGYVRDTILYTLFNPILFLWIIVEGKEKVKVPSTQSFFLLTGTRTLFSKIWQLIEQLIHVSNIILGTVNDDGDDDGDANYDQDYEC